MPVFELLTDLIRFPSVSSTSNRDVSEYLADRLAQDRFAIERVAYTDPAGVEKLNIIAKRPGTSDNGSGGFAYFGHTDVVPAKSWTGPGEPFSPVVEGDRLYGRGSCDMKGSIAAMLTACEQASDHDLPIWIVLTGDEETGMWGALRVAQESESFRDLVNRDAAGIIGEPTAGQVIHGHKGIAVWTATANGRVGHSSSREGESATLRLVPFLTAVRGLADELETDSAWHDDRYEPASPTLNLTVDDDAPALNVTSGLATARILVRNAPNLDLDSIDRRLRHAADESGAKLSPLLKRDAIYRDPNSEYVQSLDRLVGNGVPTTVPYGTDGSCFGAVERLAVFGPGSIAQAHTPNEYIELDALDNGVSNFAQLIDRFASTEG